MAGPFNMPDEYVQGLFKAGQSFVQSFAGGHSDGSAGAVAPAGTALAAYWQRQITLWAGMLSNAAGTAQEPAVAPEHGDRRFTAEEWRANPWYRLLKQTYLLNSRLLADMVEAADLGEKEKHKMRFYARQFIDAMSPANYALTNPDVQKLALETQGESIKAGLANLFGDLRKGRLSITDETAFDVGTNVAASKGSVVFENDLFQLIQYAPLTDTVAIRPLVIVPPCINKFYILDLQPDNSFVRFVCEQGMTVFLVSWRNPGAEQAGTTWDNYLEQGVMKAIEVALAISGADKVNALGWCVGGTMLSSALAVMRSQGDKRVASLTLLTTMLDFRDPGDLGVFIDERGVSQREQTIGSGGIYPGAELGTVFQTLRANDLIWPNVINNYLKGKSPEAFDLLYWNADGTNLPGPMYAWYLRNMYLENKLCVPNQLTMCDTKVTRPDRHAELCAGDAGGPYRALEVGLPHDATVGRQIAVRARRQRPHRRCHQPGVEEQAQLLGRRQAGRRPRGLAGHGGGGPGQLVDGLDEVAEAPGRQDGPGARAARQREAQADRAGPRPIRQGPWPMINRSIAPRSTPRPLPTLRGRLSRGLLGCFVRSCLTPLASAAKKRFFTQLRGMRPGS